MSKLVKLMRESWRSNTVKLSLGLGSILGLVSQSDFLMDLLSQNPKYLGWFGLAQTGLLVFQRVRKGHVNIWDVVKKALKAAAEVPDGDDDAEDE